MENLNLNVSESPLTDLEVVAGIGGAGGSLDPVPPDKHI